MIAARVTVSQTQMILDRITEVRDDLKEDIANLRSESRTGLARVEAQTTKTNGSVADLRTDVDKLKLARAKFEGARWAVGWIPPTATALGAAILGAAVAHFLG